MDLLIDRIKNQGRSGHVTQYTQQQDINAEHLAINKVQVSGIAHKNPVAWANLEAIKETTETRDYKNIPIIQRNHTVPRSVDYGYDQDSHRYTPDYRVKKEALSKPRSIESRPYIPNPNLPRVHL